jgi:hypothetical protein
VIQAEGARPKSALRERLVACAVREHQVDHVLLGAMARRSTDFVRSAED